jgi:hypothetical protein
VLEFQLPDSPDPRSFRERNDFQLDPAIRSKLDQPAFKVSTAGGIQVLSATVNSGQAYIDECAANQVPIPPSIGVLDPAGTSGWRSLGFIPPASQFITGTPAELRTFVSPQGMCFALPRYNNSSLTNVILDGVICLSKITSKVCFWDNQMGGTTFQFPAGTRIPIGVANAAVDPSLRYQAGGKEIENNPTAGVCTNCHAGQNPYIIHPELGLTSSTGVPNGTTMGSLNQAPLNLPTFAPARYDPSAGRLRRCIPAFVNRVVGLLQRRPRQRHRQDHAARRRRLTGRQCRRDQFPQLVHVAGRCRSGQPR